MTTKEGSMKIRTCAVAAAALLLGAPAAFGDAGNPHYRSNVTSVTPAVKGLAVTVLDYDDRLQIHNQTGRTVLVDDYKGKPYVRFGPDGTVEVNTNSEAYYLDDDRFGDVPVPKGLGSQPRWKLLSKTGRYDWHDHRIHWMSRTDPPQLKNKNARTHIFNWQVPIRVGARPGSISGSLTWVPLESSLPTGAIVVLALLTVGGGIAVLIVRRRQRDDADEPKAPAAEAW
jgi:hypothetical protein